MKINLESTVTVKIVLSVEDIDRICKGEMILQVTEGEADEKPMYICITAGVTNE